MTGWDRKGAITCWKVLARSSNRMWMLDQPRFAVALLLVLGLLLRLPNFLRSLWYDEVVKATHQINSSLSRLWHFVSTDYAAPLHPVLMFFWVEVFGEHEFSVRLPSLLFGLASLVLTYRIARRFEANALLAMVIVCFSPAHVWYSQEGTHYTMYGFLVLLAVYVWPRVARAPLSWPTHAIYFVSLLTASFTHYYAVLLLVPFTLLSLRAEKRMRRVVWLEHALIVVLLGLWLIGQYGRGGVVSGQGHLRPFTLFEWWMLFFHWYLHGNTLASLFPYRADVGDLLGRPGLLVLQVGFALLLGRGLWRRHEKEGRWPGAELAMYLCVLPLAMFVLTQVGFHHMYTERYLFVGVPFFAIALARGVTGLAPAGVRALLAGIVLTVSVSSYVTLQRTDASWTVYKNNPDWRTAAQSLRDQYATDPKMILVGVIPLDDLDFYLRTLIGNPRPPVFRYIANTFERIVARRQANQIVVVKNLVWPARVDAVIERCRRDPRLRLLSRRSFYLVEFYTFVYQDTARP